MTFCKTLKETTTNGITITAYEEMDKYSIIPHYTIVVSREGLGIISTPTARTTWRKAFKTAVNEWA